MWNVQNARGIIGRTQWKAVLFHLMFVCFRYLFLVPLSCANNKYHLRAAQAQWLRALLTFEYKTVYLNSQRINDKFFKSPKIYFELDHLRTVVKESWKFYFPNWRFSCPRICCGLLQVPVCSLFPWGTSMHPRPEYSTWHWTDDDGSRMKQ